MLFSLFVLGCLICPNLTKFWTYFSKTVYFLQVFIAVNGQILKNVITLLRAPVLFQPQNAFS